MSHEYTPNEDNNPTSATLPDDGPDLRSAATVNVPFEAALDKANFACVRLPEYRSNAHAEAGTDPTAWTAWDTVVTPVTFSDFMTALQEENPFTTRDRVLFRLYANVKTGGGEGLVRLVVGLSPSGPFTELPGSAVARARITSDLTQVVLEASWTPPADGNYIIKPQCISAASTNILAYGPAQLITDLRRKNT